MKQLSALILGMLLLICLPVSAQSESADFMRETGKIYVVVAVLATILIVLLIYLAYIDRKVRRIENEIKDDHEEG